MSGVSMDEMKEFLSRNHDIEFTYHNEEYVMQKDIIEVEEGGPEVLCLLIWKTIPADGEDGCIYKNPVPQVFPTPGEYIDAILNEKCFDGKSFMEIEEEVTVDAVL